MGWEKNVTTAITFYEMFSEQMDESDHCAAFHLQSESSSM